MAEVTNKAVRLNHLDLTRATEQTAIVASLCQGRGYETRQKNYGTDTNQTSSSINQKPKKSDNNKKPRGVRHETREELPWRSLLGYLASSHCWGNLLPFDPRQEQYQDVETRTTTKSIRKGKVKELLDTFRHEFGEQQLTPEQVSKLNPRQREECDEWRLDLGAIPVHGIDALQQGERGAISVIVGSSPAGLHVPRPLDSKRYLVVLINSRLKSPSGNYAPACAADPQTLALNSLRQICEHSAMPPALMTVARMSQPKPQLMAAIGARFRVRTFKGSAVGASLTAALPNFGIDAFCDYVDATDAVMIAVASLATGSTFLAIPDTGETQILFAEHFVPGKESFLIATGITGGGPVLGGVQFLDQDVVSTNTVCLRARTKSVRFLIHHHNLSEKAFRLWNSEKRKFSVCEWKDVMKESEAMFRTDELLAITE